MRRQESRERENASRGPALPENTTALDRAFDLHKRGDFAEARSVGETALPQHPDNPSLLRLLGDSSCRSGDLTRGVEYLRKAYDLTPADLQIRLDLANALAALGDLSTAEAVCGTDASQSPELGRLRGYILNAQGRHGEAIDAYGLVLDKNPDDWETWNNLGNALRAAGDRETAAEALARATRLRPDAVAVHLNLGATLVELGRLQDSVAAYQAAARLAPDQAPIQFEFGRLLRYLGRLSEALAPLERAAELAPLQGEILLEIGKHTSELQSLMRI